MRTPFKYYVYPTLVGASIFAITGIYKLLVGDVSSGKIYVFMSLIGFSASFFVARLGKKAG